MSAITRWYKVFDKTIFSGRTFPEVTSEGAISPIDIASEWVNGSVQLTISPGSGKTITWYVSNDGGNYNPCKNSAGTDLTAQACDDNAFESYPIPAEVFYHQFAFPVLSSAAPADMALKFCISG